MSPEAPTAPVEPATEPTTEPTVAPPQAPRIAGDPETYYTPRRLCPGQRRDAADGSGPG